MTDKKYKISYKDINNLIYETNRLNIKKVANAILAFEKAIKLCMMMNIDIIKYIGNKKPIGVSEETKIEIEELQERFLEYIAKDDIYNRFLAFKTGIKLCSMMDIDLIQFIDKENINGVSENVKLRIEKLQEEFMKYIDDIEELQIEADVLHFIQKTIDKELIKKTKSSKKD